VLPSLIFLPASIPAKHRQRSIPQSSSGEVNGGDANTGGVNQTPVSGVLGALSAHVDAIE
jgi:hypothetical protein